MLLDLGSTSCTFVLRFLHRVDIPPNSDLPDTATPHDVSTHLRSASADEFAKLRFAALRTAWSAL